MSFLDKSQSNGIMISRIIFCTAVSLTILAVLLLSVLSPVPYKNNDNEQDKPLITFSLFIQQPRTPSPDIQRVEDSSSGVFTFHRILTEGPHSTSKIVGKAQGFIIPVDHFAYSAFNIIYLTFHTPDYSGSLSIRAKQLEHKKREELVVLGGTGSFAFARGVAVFEETIASFYQVNLQLTFPNQVQSIRV
ncbi:dirigent protein 11 [Silene latifolia]|uniref:dirigent protein 11 n=1 Tax=Silene latifolia TaxID=37657 RepID=UPI003D76E762